jgi:hypothetical protein
MDWVGLDTNEKHDDFASFDQRIVPSFFDLHSTAVRKCLS